LGFHGGQQVSEGQLLDFVAYRNLVETLDRIIAWQVKTAGWHLAETAGPGTRQSG
jgi:hypothetical protein